MLRFFKEILNRRNQIPNLQEKVIFTSSVIGLSFGAFIMAKDQKYCSQECIINSFSLEW